MSRLTLLPFCPSDAPALFQILREPSAMQFTYVAPSLKACTTRLEAWESQRAVLGFAPWVIRRAETSTILGWGGIGVDPEDPEWGPEVVYAFDPSAWGQGFATELVAHSVAIAFTQHSLPKLDAFVHPGNHRSAKVLHRCGFALVGHQPALKRNRYRIARERGVA